MKYFLFLYFPLLIFSFSSVLLEKEAMVSEFIEDPYTNFYFNPALLTELKEKFIGFEIYSDGKRPQFTSLAFVNKDFPYAIIFNHFESERFSERNLTFILAKRGKNYSYGFKFQLGKRDAFYEDKYSYEESWYNYERETAGDSNEYEFYFYDCYGLEEIYFREFGFSQNKSDLFLFPFSFYLRKRDFDIGVDLNNSIEKLIIKRHYENVRMKFSEGYEFTKRGDTVLTYYNEEYNKEKSFYQKIEDYEETSKVITKDISIFLRKRDRGLRDERLLFGRFGFFSEIAKGVLYYKWGDSAHKSSLKWKRWFEDGEYYEDGDFEEYGDGYMEEGKVPFEWKREGIYQEIGLSYTYTFSFLKIYNNLFFGIRERVDYLIDEKKWKSRFIFYLGNKLEKEDLIIFPIFLPIISIVDKKKQSYGYNIFLRAEKKIFDIFLIRFTHLWQSDFLDFSKRFKIPKIKNKKWALSLFINY